MDATNNQTKPSLPSAFSLIERAQELKWTLQFAIAVLFADLVLVWRTGTGIAHWSIQADALLANSGFLIVSILAFGVLMSMILPFAGGLLREVVWLLLVIIPRPEWTQRDPENSRPLGGVLSSELRDEAYREEDWELLDVVAAHREREEKRLVDKLAFGQTIFSVLVLGFLDYLPGVMNLQASTLLREAVVTFGTLCDLALMGALLLGFSALKLAWFSIDPMKWIIYPRLYHKQQKKRSGPNFRK